MPTYQKQFAEYKIIYMTGGNEVPLIDCYDGSTHVGKISFHDEGMPLPPNLVTSTGVLYLRYRLKQFKDVMDILRYEKPLFLRLTTPSLVGFIATQQGEPVGEQE
jgi:hypothetical protein